MRKMIYMLIAFIMMLALGTAQAYAGGYVTIAELREEAEDGWHETYTYKGEEIRIDVDIEIPEVDSVPVVLVKWSEALTPKYAPPGAIPLEGLSKGEIGYAYYKNFTQDDVNYAASPDRYIEDGAQAENCPITPEEAIQVFKNILQPYMEEFNCFDLQLNYIDAWSRLYKMIDITDSGDVLDYDKPVSNMGWYQVEFYQVFHGIPFINNYLQFEEGIKAETDLWNGEGGLGQIFAGMSSPDDYSMIFCPAVEERLLAEDIPLAQLSNVKNEIIQLIESGYIRDIYRLRLAYVSLYNPDDLRSTRVLFPVWEVYGEIMRSPKAPTPVYAPEEMEKVLKFGGTSLFINAQTGTHYNPKDKSSDRSHAKYVTWDEVK